LSHTISEIPRLIGQHSDILLYPYCIVITSEFGNYSLQWWSLSGGDDWW